MTSASCPEHLEPDEWELLRAVAVGGPAVPDDRNASAGQFEPGQFVELVVTGCVYSCCGKGWQRRHGYEQTYTGYVDNLNDFSLMLYSLGVGTISYVIAVRFAEIAAMRPLAITTSPSWPR